MTPRPCWTHGWTGLLLAVSLWATTGCSGITSVFGARVPADGGAAFNFAFDTFSGERLTLGDMRGKLVVLNFWASWCIPCRAEMPYFEKVYQSYRERGVVFVGLAVQDDPGSARDFLGAVGVTYPTGMDRRNEAASGYEVVGLPTTVVITSQATVARRWNGPVSESELSAALDDLLKTGKGAASS